LDFVHYVLQVSMSFQKLAHVSVLLDADWCINCVWWAQLRSIAIFLNWTWRQPVDRIQFC
jgi:hypothetical protein